MKPTLRLLRLYLGWSGLLLIACLTLQIAIMGTPGTRRQFSWALINVFLAATLLGARYVRISRAPMWRWLPGGQRALRGSLTIVVVAGVLLVGGIVVWAQMRGLFHLQMPSAGAVSIIVALVCTLLVPPVRARVWNALQSVGTRLDAGGLLAGSPESRILRSGRSWVILPVALLATFCVPLILHDLLEVHARDSYTAVAGGAAGFTAVAILLLGIGMARRARLLWLRCGESRAQMLRYCERTLWADLGLLIIFAFLAPSALALALNGRFDVERAFLLIPALAAGSLGPLYLGLAWPTFASWWRNMPIGHIVLVAALLLPLVWRAAYAIVQPLERAPSPVLVVIGLFAAVALRAFAIWRWRRIDWTYLSDDKV